MFIIRNIRKPEFKDLIKENNKSIKDRLISSNSSNNQIGNSILEYAQYKILELQYIKRLWVQLRNEKMLIFINVSAIKTLEKIDFQFFLEKIEQKRVNFNKILIGNKLEILDEEDCQYDLQFKAQEVSRSNKIAFYLDNSGVTVYFEGKKVKTSIFYDDKDFIDYSNRRPITELREVLEEYKTEHLINIKDKFFEDEEIIKTCNLHNQMLLNDIDELLKNDLVEYLTKNLQYTFTKNGPLQGTGYNVDAYTIADDKLYFITIEWLGSSMNPCRSKVGVIHNEERIGEAIQRTLDYIYTICNRNEIPKHGSDFGKAYLTLFDARQECSEIQYKKLLDCVDAKYSSVFKYFEIIGKYNLRRNEVVYNT